MVLTGKVSRELVGRPDQRARPAGRVVCPVKTAACSSAMQRRPIIDRQVHRYHPGRRRGFRRCFGSRGSGGRRSIPVVSSVAQTEDATEVLNVNADSAAAALAAAMGAHKLVILTDVDGLYADWPDKNSLIGRIGVETLRDMLPDLESGMRPRWRPVSGPSTVACPKPISSMGASRIRF